MRALILLLVMSIPVQGEDLRLRATLGKNHFHAPGTVFDFCFSPSGRSLFSIDATGNLLTWETSTGKLLHCRDLEEAPKRAKFAYSLKRRTLILDLDDCASYIFFPSRNRLGKEFQCRGRSIGRHIVFVGEPGRVAISRDSRKVAVVTLKPWDICHTYNTHWGQVTAMAYSPKRDLLTTGGARSEGSLLEPRIEGEGMLI